MLKLFLKLQSRQFPISGPKDPPLSPSKSVRKSDKGGPLLLDFCTLPKVYKSLLGISDPQSSGLSSLKGDAKPGGGG